MWICGRRGSVFLADTVRLTRLFLDTAQTLSARILAPAFVSWLLRELGGSLRHEVSSSQSHCFIVPTSMPVD